jgi:hypothetical protein
LGKFIHCLPQSTQALLLEARYLFSIHSRSCSTSRRSPGVSYRLVEVAKRSQSKVSMPIITLSDMLKVAGVQRLNPNDEERDIERLVDFGLRPENVVYPQHGYL